MDSYWYLMRVLECASALEQTDDVCAGNWVSGEAPDDCKSPHTKSHS